MKLGSLQNISWSNFEVREFRPKLSYSCMDYRTCGTAVISMLTGEVPRKIESKLPKRQLHWSNAALTGYLKNKGFAVQEITVNSVVGEDWQDFPITDSHIVILNLRVDKRDASWFLLYRGVLYHNFSSERFGPLWLLNKPIQNCFVVSPNKKRKYT